MNRRVLSAAAALTIAGLTTLAYAPAAQAATKNPVNVANYTWSYNGGLLTVTETLTHAVNGKVSPLSGVTVSLVCATPAKTATVIASTITNTSGTATFTKYAVDNKKYAACAVGFIGDATNGPAAAAFVLPGAASTVASKTTTTTKAPAAAPKAPAASTTQPNLASTGGAA